MKMSYKNIFYLGLVFLMLFGGCGLKEGVVQKEPKSFLWFTGNTQNAIVYIDNINPITLSEWSSHPHDESGVSRKRNSQFHYELSPGKHTIIVKNDGVVVVNRNILLGSGITKEIQIP